MQITCWLFIYLFDLILNVVFVLCVCVMWCNFESQTGWSKGLNWSVELKAVNGSDLLKDLQQVMCPKDLLPSLLLRLDGPALPPAPPSSASSYSSTSLLSYMLHWFWCSEFSIHDSISSAWVGSSGSGCRSRFVDRSREEKPARWQKALILCSSED